MKNSKTRFYKKKLKNRLTVLFEKREIPIVSIGLATRFGSVYETEKEKGIAHFVEHMLFKGTKKRTAKQIGTEIHEKGAEHNAFTAKTFTAAWIKLPSKYLEFGIEILSDIFQNSQFYSKELEKERKTILEEIKMYHDTPMRHVFEELNELMYDKPFGVSSLGTKENVSGFSRKTLMQKYKEKYSPKNFILCVVGNADFDDVIKFAEKYFKGGGNRSKENEEIKHEEDFINPGIKKGEKLEKRKDLQQAHLCFGVHFPKLNEKGRYAAKIFNSIFAEDSSSRIYQEIREKRGLAYAVLGLLDQEASHGEEIVYIGTSKDKINLVKRLIVQEFKKMQNITKQQVEKTKEKLINLFSLEQEDSKNVLFNLLLEEITGNAHEYYDFEKKIKKINLKEVVNLARKKDFSFSALVPG